MHRGDARSPIIEFLNCSMNLASSAILAVDTVNSWKSTVKVCEGGKSDYHYDLLPR
jgi:hypothetical protein